MISWHDMAWGWHKMWQKVAFSGAKMSKKGGGAGDGKITPKNPSLRMRPRGGFLGGSRKTGIIKHEVL